MVNFSISKEIQRVLIQLTYQHIYNDKLYVLIKLFIKTKNIFFFVIFRYSELQNLVLLTTKSLK